MRGQYARLCVEIPLDLSVQPFIYIDTHKQYIHYEGENLLCMKCERLGHTSPICKFIQQNTKVNSCPENATPSLIKEKQEGEWKTVIINKGKRQHVKNNPSNNLIPEDKLQGPGPRLPTTFVDGNGANGTCNILQHPSKWPGGNSNPSPHSISSTNNNGGDGFGNEQLLEPNLAQQHPPTSSTIVESKPSSCNDTPVEHATSLQPNKPTECPLRHSLLPIRDTNSSESHLHALGNQPPTTESTTQPREPSCITTSPT
uniref:Uncharacterized protein n=1 Tax=Nicotiana tabacum TaxID=4097 RepID=A0A1S4C6I5_TOBAC|nr:PREDICTED: uncharacterized protein LOC107815591 [Nicotiana tabacum]